MSSAGGTLFGGVFVAVGSFVVLIGLRIIDPGGKLHVPHWVLLPIGAVFASAGLLVWWKAWRQYRDARRRAQRTLRYPDDSARADHDWNPDGVRSDLRAPAVRATAMAAFFILFLIPFNYIAIKEDQRLWGVIVGVFDLITLFLIGNAILQWSRAFKFGRTLLRFSEFPFRVGNPVRLTWVAPSGCAGAATGSFTLRAIREWHETSGAGKSKTTRLVHEEQWSGAWELSSPSLITPGMTCDLTFDLPPDAPGTNMHAERPLFWELEVALRLPGPDFKDTYLVPVYSFPNNKTS